MHTHLDMEALPLRECERLLAGGGVGVLALGSERAPILRPVNFALRAGWLWIRTGEGQILAAAKSSTPASFVLSEIDRLEHTGWSVVVVGTLVERSSSGSAADLPLRPWARGDKRHLVAISIDEISGRRIAPPREDA